MNIYLGVFFNLTNPHYLYILIFKYLLLSHIREFAHFKNLPRFSSLIKMSSALWFNVNFCSKYMLVKISHLFLSKFCACVSS